MKVLIIIGSFKTGGAERMSINTGEELSRLGYDVYYIVQRPIFEIPNSIPDDKITVLRKDDDSTLFYKIKSLFYGTYLTSKRINPDVVIGFSRFSSFLANFTFNKNVIARFDANPFRLSRKQRIWADIVLKSPLVKKVVLPSTGMHKALRDIRPNSEDKFIVIPNSINSKDISLRIDEIKNPYPFEYIVSMGRMTSQKNFELLINAYSKSRITQNLKLIIIGDGPQLESLKNLVSDLDLSNEIIFTGRLSNPFPIVKNSKFLVNPSSYESFCNVILEALTLSKAVIATDCNYGPSDMVINNVNGFLIEVDNLDQMIFSLNKLALEPQLLKKFEDNSRETAERFRIANIGIMWEDLISNLESNK